MTSSSRGVGVCALIPIEPATAEVQRLAEIARDGWPTHQTQALGQRALEALVAAGMPADHPEAQALVQAVVDR